ncbi:MAG: hypothetical protein DRQ39_08510 [Gammaproteobacteria bacterium]|nr:MAG: hypothetical protein DRQ39_08510 [Gammaproteobacteria bacterium]
MQYDETQGEGYIRDDVKLVVESIDDSLVITYAQLEIEDLYNLTIELVDRMARATQQTYNSVLSDLMEIEEESE